MQNACFPTDLSDAQWRTILPHLPKPARRGRPRTDLRRIVRIRPMNWPDDTVPREEYTEGHLEERFPTPVIFPKYGRIVSVTPSTR